MLMANSEEITTEETSQAFREMQIAQGITIGIVYLLFATVSAGEVLSNDDQVNKFLYSVLVALFGCTAVYGLILSYIAKDSSPEK